MKLSLALLVAPVAAFAPPRRSPRPPPSSTPTASTTARCGTWPPRRTSGAPETPTPPARRRTSTRAGRRPTLFRADSVRRRRARAVRNPPRLSQVRAQLRRQRLRLLRLLPRRGQVQGPPAPGRRLRGDDGREGGHGRDRGQQEAGRRPRRPGLPLGGVPRGPHGGREPPVRPRPVRPRRAPAQAPRRSAAPTMMI